MTARIRSIRPAGPDLFDVLPHELIVDNFAGGGGASLGIEMALGRSPDIAINHDPAALGMHERNHPNTRHFCESVWDVDPKQATAGRPVGLAWFSPDCKHFSKAKGGKPVSKRIRGLAWVVIKWARAVKPRVICLENVEEFQKWGPLVGDRPCPKRIGKTFKRWKRSLHELGYKVEHRELRACDYGAPTSRKRLFLIARRDGQPIAWPAATHGPGLLPYRTAADCIDWSIPCPSIFERRKPLAEATQRRIAAGIKRFVIEAAEPFIVKYHSEKRPSEARIASLAEPLPTQTTENRFALVAPTLVQTGYGERAGQRPRYLDLHAPLGTVMGDGQKHALVSAFLAKHYTGVVGQQLEQPIGTVTAIDHHSLVTSNLVKLYGTSAGATVEAPMPTVTADGQHIAEVRAFLVKYYGEGGQWADLADPMHTIPTKDRMGLVMVKGEPYQIADIGLRMLRARELFRAQGFPDSYVIDQTAAGKALTHTDQVRMCGNSVCPPLAAAIVAAQFPAAFIERKAA